MEFQKLPIKFHLRILGNDLFLLKVGLKDWDYNICPLCAGLYLCIRGVNLSVSHDSIPFRFLRSQLDLKLIHDSVYKGFSFGKSVYKILEFFLKNILNCKLLKCKHLKTNLKQKETFINAKFVQIKTFDKKFQVFKFSENPIKFLSRIKLINW